MSKSCTSVPVDCFFISANGAEPDEMPHFGAFHLGSSLFARVPLKTSTQIMFFFKLWCKLCLHQFLHRINQLIFILLNPNIYVVGIQKNWLYETVLVGESIQDYS